MKDHQTLNTIDKMPAQISVPEQKSLADDRLVFKRTHVYAALLPLTFVLGLAVGYLFWGRASAAPPPAAAVVPTAATQAAQAEQTVKRYDVPEDDDPVRGPATAAITIIEFSDFECPYCQSWHNEVWLPLQAAFPGQIRLVFRDFPLPGHPNAAPSAQAANCAQEQGRFWEYHDLLFTWELGLARDAHLEYARRLGLDMDAFTQCLDEGRYAAEVQADFDYAANLGVRSTPTFFINGLPMVGAQPLDVFTQVIEKELAGEIP